MNHTLNCHALGLSKEFLIEKGGFDTAYEIAGQPELWMRVYQRLMDQRIAFKSFLNNNLKSGTQIILTGAGSSAFIGLALQGTFFRETGISTSAIATTDLISHPLNYINPDGKYLVISFARSGDSPESIGALEIINQICPNTSHIIITCNSEGKLVKHFKGETVYPLILPPESNDKGLAMTGSFTSMLLTGLIIAKIDAIQDIKPEIELLCHYGRYFLNDYLPLLSRIAEIDFERAVFLGSGPLNGCATESHLKLQELTNGKIVCKYDSYLGLRHGPKAVINSKTLVIALMSNNKYAARYEADMVRDIIRTHNCHFLIIAESKPEEDYSGNHIYLNEYKLNKISEDLLPVCFVLPAQIIGFLKAIKLGLPPDSPSLNKAISRVVEGVNIYPYS
jgi:tagatose-6-phosphate ketose/aldose isomerase